MHASKILSSQTSDRRVKFAKEVCNNFVATCQSYLKKLAGNRTNGVKRGAATSMTHTIVCGYQLESRCASMAVSCGNSCLLVERNSPTSSDA